MAWRAWDGQSKEHLRFSRVRVVDTSISTVTREFKAFARSRSTRRICALPSSPHINLTSNKPYSPSATDRELFVICGSNWRPHE